MKLVPSQYDTAKLDWHIDMRITYWVSVMSAYAIVITFCCYKNNLYIGAQ